VYCCLLGCYLGDGYLTFRPPNIELARWRRELTHAHPAALRRGLIHSHGCRTENRFRTLKQDHPSTSTDVGAHRPPIVMQSRHHREHLQAH
jgi:hypothetical protein